VLTAKSFARRNRSEIDANQELIAFGTCNIAAGLAQGFPVTGADSRTAVNNAMGGQDPAGRGCRGWFHAAYPVLPD
jgi:MFS superfamily sulfate permease-like transporter